MPTLDSDVRPETSSLNILSVSSISTDHAELRHMLFQTPWRMASVHTCRSAKAVLQRQSVSVIVCERDLPDGNWRDLLGLAGHTARSPLMIVTSRLADEHLWAEVLNLGGYDVLAKPFHEQEVRHVLASAENRYEQQDRLAVGN